MKELLSTQDLKQASITKDATHLHINFIDQEGIGHTIKIPLVNTQPSAPFKQPAVVEIDAHKVQRTKPSIVRVDRTEDGKQIERRSNGTIIKAKQRQYPSDHVHFARKLTESQVREIKTLLADKEYMREFKSEYAAHKDLGKVYKVNYMTITMIARGMTWKHVSWSTNRPEHVYKLLTINHCTAYPVNDCILSYYLPCTSAT